MYKQYFKKLNDNVKKAKTKKTLKAIEKFGEKYVKNLPKEINKKIKVKAKKELIILKKKIRNKVKKL